MRKLILFLLVVLAGCKSDDALKGVNQSWLNTTTADIEKSDLKQYFYIVKADYEGNCVTYVNNCCPMCATAIIVYSCDGTKLENVDLTKLQKHTVIWKPDNFSCSL